MEIGKPHARHMRKGPKGGTMLGEETAGEKERRACVQQEGEGAKERIAGESFKKRGGQDYCRATRQCSLSP